MTRNEFYLACLLVFVILAGVAYRDRVGGGGAINPVVIRREDRLDLRRVTSAEIPPVTALININRAASGDLLAVPGIDREAAENIIAFRERYGPFSDLRELMEVPGIDRARYERLRPYVRLADLPKNEVPGSPVVRTPLPGGFPAAFAPVIKEGGKSPFRFPLRTRPGDVIRLPQAGQPSGLIDLNRATLADLEAVEGIGVVLAKRILEARKQRGSFRSWNEVEAVSGIGQTRLQLLQRHFYIPQR